MDRVMPERGQTNTWPGTAWPGHWRVRLFWRSYGAARL